MKKVLIVLSCLLSINTSTVLSQTSDQRWIWSFRPAPQDWYLSASEACADSRFFRPRIENFVPGPDGLSNGSGYFNPRATNVEPNGDIRDNSNLGPSGRAIKFCYGDIMPPSGEIFESFFGVIRGFSCENTGFSRDEVFQHLCGTPINDTPDENQGGTCNEIGNPCNTATGNKVQTETDFAYSGLSFVRTYNSQNLVDIGSGRGWRTNYQSKLTVSGDSLVLISKSGKGEPWTRVNGQWQGDADTKLIVEQSNDQFTVTYPNDRTEQYNANGQLEVQTDSNGFNTTYTYDDENQLIEVENHYGKKIQFSYLSGRIETVTDPDGVLYRYEYDGVQNLTAVVYPDLTPDTDGHNPRRIYHYEDERFLSHLTGITDENGDRYATWSYDEEGRAISSEHAQTTNEVGQEKVELDFQ